MILSQLSILVCPLTAVSVLKSMKALHNSLLLLQIKVHSLESGWTLESWGQKREVIQGVVLGRLSVGASSGFLFTSLRAIHRTVHETQ